MACKFDQQNVQQHDVFLQARVEGCLVQVGNGIELQAVVLQFEPYL